MDCVVLDGGMACSIHCIFKRPPGWRLFPFHCGFLLLLAAITYHMVRSTRLFQERAMIEIVVFILGLVAIVGLTKWLHPQIHNSMGPLGDCRGTSLFFAFGISACIVVLIVVLLSWAGVIPLP